jgi:MFS family permease
VKFTADSFVIPFVGTYLSIVVLTIIGINLFFFLDIPKPSAPSANAPAGRSRRELLKDPVIVVSIICAMVSYALMNLVMTSTPLAVVGCGFDKNNAADIVSAHVLAMFIENFYIALILLGIGWNFGFIGATTMLAGAHSPNERGALQGMNDFFVFGGVTLASLASGGLMNCSGGSAQQGWTAVNIAMVPFLVLAGGSLIWLWLRPQKA